MTWIQTLVENEGEREKAVREFTLRAFRRGSEPINHWILRTAEANNAVSVDELEAELGISKPAVSERVNDLVQVGLLERNVDGDRVQSTVLTAGFVGMVDEVTDLFGGKIVDEFESHPRGSNDDPPVDT